ncbi:cytochrome c [Robertmurraya sp. DFI.2.37]|uniref:c-type cytochrome n=1 Tax=Robertmurraya sp. DFI.2.37 TaxID=3031819 RepID=UPI001CD930DD|nr:cytochrome c [Robertmurraya sp. DFI.2.37]MDF1507873.1 cytochrome c [Robertmurraya sp. DFI.2.37]
MKKQHLAVLAALIIVLIALVFFTLQSEKNDGGNNTDTTTETNNNAETNTNDDSNEQAGDEEEVVSVDYEKSYAQKCSTCHGGDLTGGVGPELTQIGANMSKEEIEQIILDGIGIMPGGQLKGEEASAVAEWLADMK